MAVQSVPDDLYGSRREKFHVTLLDSEDREKRPLMRITGGSMEINTNAQVPGTGNVTLRYSGDAEVDWGADRIRLVYEANGHSWPLGVYLIEAPGEEHEDGVGLITTEISLMDKISVLDQDKVDGSYSLPKGANIVKEAEWLIESAGEDRITSVATDKTLPNGKTWDPGTSKLEIVNDLLTMINYRSVYCDRYGRFRLDPYREPLNRAVQHTFTMDEKGLRQAAWQRSQDWYAVPNKYVAITQGDDEEDPMVGVATNTDPNSKFSYPRRGNRWIVTTEENVEAADQETLNALAKRKLRDASTKVTHLEVSHAVLPLWVDDLVEFEAPGYWGLATVQKFSMDLEVGAQMDATWREADYEIR